MASLTIKTNLLNVTDSQSSTTSVSLDGAPFSTSDIITSRTFTSKANTSFTVKPYIDFSNVSDKNAYKVTKTVTSTYTTFTIQYARPLSPPTTDIITFYAKAKLTNTIAGANITAVNIKSDLIPSTGQNRLLTIYGDPGAKFILDVKTKPKISPAALGVTMIPNGPITATINSNGIYTKGIKFPSTTELTDYSITVSETSYSNFKNGLISPHVITLTQYPIQQVQLLVSDGGSVSSSIASDSGSGSTTTIYFAGEYGSQTSSSFKCTVTKNSDDLYAGQTDTTDGAFTGTNMQMDTSYVTKKVAVGDIITHANLNAGTYITAVNVGGVNDTYTISEPPTAEIADAQTITFDTFTPYKDPTNNTYDDFTITTGQGAVTKQNLALDTQEESNISISNTAIVIDNEPTNATAVITGEITINHKYDGHSGHTRVALDVNKILRL